MVTPKNDVDIYYAFRNTNIQRQENKIGLIIKKRNSARLKLVSTINATIDTKTNFRIYTYFEKS